MSKRDDQIVLSTRLHMSIFKLANEVETTDMTRIGKWGHSGAIRICANVLECAKLGIGDEVFVRALDDGSLLIVPARKRNGAAVSFDGKSDRTPKKEAEEKW